MLGLVDNNVESVKIIGRYDMNMDANLRKIFRESDYYYQTTLKHYFYPYFNDAKELLRI